MEECKPLVVGPRDRAALAALLGAAGAQAVAALEAKVAVTPHNSWRRASTPGGAGSSEAEAPEWCSGGSPGAGAHAGVNTMVSGAGESQSPMAHAICFWQAALWLVLYDEGGEVTHTTAEGVFARVGDSWWMVPPRRPPHAGCARPDVPGPAAALTSLEDTVEALTAGPTEPADRPARTMEALGLLLAVVATPTDRVGDVPGYVRATAMGLLWNLATRDVVIEHGGVTCGLGFRVRV